MSKAAVMKLVETRFSAFTFDGIDIERKSYPNVKNTPTPSAGRWLRLKSVQFVLHKMVGIGSDPYTRRTGVIVIDSFDRLDVGTKRILELTDALEDWFFPFEAPNFWTGAPNTPDYPDDGDKKGYYQLTTYIPFTYDEV